MARTLTTIAFLIAVPLLWVSGCGKNPRSAEEQGAESDTTPTSQESTLREEPSTDRPLSELSQAERDAVLAQGICLVSGQDLGSMGRPPKVNLDGNAVWICCAACEDELKSDPQKYLTQLADRGVQPPDFNE